MMTLPLMFSWCPHLLSKWVYFFVSLLGWALFRKTLCINRDVLNFFSSCSACFSCLIEKLNQESENWNPVLAFDTFFCYCAARSSKNLEVLLPFQKQSRKKNCRALERRAPERCAPERRSEWPERGRSATPDCCPERYSERRSGKWPERWSASCAPTGAPRHLETSKK